MKAQQETRKTGQGVLRKLTIKHRMIQMTLKMIKDKKEKRVAQAILLSTETGA
jgi:pimeloyl-CoA synthetase